MTEASDTKPCIACRESISAEAMRCRICGSSQSWGRHFALSDSLLSLLVALVSVTGLSLPVIVNALRQKNSRLVLRFAGSANDDVFLAISNTGTRSGVLTDLSFVFPSLVNSDVVRPNVSTLPMAIAPGEMKAVRIRVPQFAAYTTTRPRVSWQIRYSEIPFDGEPTVKTVSQTSREYCGPERLRPNE